MATACFKRPELVMPLLLTATGDPDDAVIQTVGWPHRGLRSPPRRFLLNQF
jgi:hypothetical protein